MAHSSEVFHAVSGTLTNYRGIHNDLGEIPAASAQVTNAKQRRLSRPNTEDEIKKKKRSRRKRKRNEAKMIPKQNKNKNKRAKLVAGVVKQIGKTREIEVKKCAIRAEEMRKQAVYFWKKWKAERIKKNNVES